LIKEFVAPLLTKNEPDLKKVISSFLGSKKPYEDEYFKWAFSRFENKLSSKNIFDNWSCLLKETFNPLIDLWGSK
jgi:hypothetical protein